MNQTLYLLGQLIIILLVAGLVSTIAFGLRYALNQLPIPPEKKQPLLKWILLGIAFWLAILALVASTGFFLNFDVLPPRIGLALLPPVLLSIALLFSRLFGLILRVLPPAWLIYIQAFRILMELFLWMGFIGFYIPQQLTFEGFNFDIIVGVTALMAGFVFFYRNRFLRFEAIIWNISGIAMLLNVLAIAVLSTPSPWQVFFIKPYNTFVGHFPFIWIPGFIVPFTLAMHLFSLKQVIRYGPKRREFQL